MKTIKILLGVFWLIVILGAGYVLANRFGLVKLPCRNQYGLPLKTGIATQTFRSKSGEMETIDTKFCYLGVEKVQDSLFPDSSVRIKIGYFDKLGFLKVFPARIGAKDLVGNNIPVGYCVADSKRDSCNSLDPLEVSSQIKSPSIVRGLVVVKDSSPWKVSDMVQKYSSFMNSFADSLASGKQLPNVPRNADFVLQVVKLSVSKP